MLTRCLGLALPPLRFDEISIILRCHAFFELVKSDWITRIRSKYKHLEITAHNERNLLNGGECLIFDVLDELKRAFRALPQVAEAISTNL
jgi:hypothetical protein